MAALALALAGAGSASAANVRVSKHSAMARDISSLPTTDFITFHELDIVGGPVDVSVSETRRTYTLHVRHGRLTPRSGCRRSGPRTVVCAARDVLRIRASLSNRSDRLDLHALSHPEFGVFVHGRGGNDTLVASRGGATLLGEKGNDVLVGSRSGDNLSGGPGRDAVRAGGGNDVLLDADAAPARDRYDGGSGRDEISYRGRRVAVTVDLGSRTGGAPGEGDTLRGLENAEGGSGDDTLTGDGGPNTLAGGPGRDRLAGGLGNDVLRQLGAADPTDPRVIDRQRDDEEPFQDYAPDLAVDGGPGADVIALAGSEKDAAGPQVSCGDGADRVVRASPNHLLPSDCETVSFPGLFRGGWADLNQDEEMLSGFVSRVGGDISAHPVRFQGGSEVFRIACSRAREPFLGVRIAPCQASLAINAGAPAAFNVAGGQSADLAVPLTPADAAVLAAGLTARVRVIPAANAPSDQGVGDPSAIGWTITLRS